jgi:tetratricopeptide (TPR) repeat protein
LDRADEVLRNAIRVLKASGFIDGAAFCEVQIARVMMEKGEYQPAEDLLRKALATFTELGETPSALDASVHLAECLLRQDRCSEALDLLDSASSTVSSESTVSAPAIMRMRSLALTRLGRPDEAWTAANSALALAKKQRLPYELALTLLAGSDLQQIPETLDTGMSKEAATEILTGLGVVRTPRPVSP